MHTCTVRKTVKVDYGVLSTQNRIFEMVPNRRHAKPLKWSLELSLSTARRTFEMVLNKFYAEPLEGILNLCFMEISKIEFYTLGKIYTEPMKGSLSKIVIRTCVRYAEPSKWTKECYDIKQNLRNGTNSTQTESSKCQLFYD